jgi:hypothetical protein
MRPLFGGFDQAEELFHQVEGDRQERVGNALTVTPCRVDDDDGGTVGIDADGEVRPLEAPIRVE